LQYCPGTLGCTSAEEAKTLIPSLADKVSDEQLESVLAELEKLEEKGAIV
jgi:DNA-directed RNA polymerase II subunit RPB4